ncbi:hypothetical protein MKW92_022448 [Papaver armeniacum]|nr:hypothetical protein MKW92_022448 [Papaver armeniacum]
MASMMSRDPYAYDVCGPKKLTTPGDLDHKRKVLACFVQAVYLLELDRQGNRTPQTALAPKWLEPSNYKLSQTLTDERDGSIFGAVLEWAGYGVLRPSGAPKAILALRGTLMYSTTVRRDFTDDLRLFVSENLEGSVRFNAALKALKLSVDRFGYWNVCMAGHSLGAGFAIQVGKALAKEKVFIETHLFNLPSVSLGGVWNRLKSIFGDNQTDGKFCTAIMNWGLHFYVNKSDFLCTKADTDVIQNGPSGNSLAAKLFVNSKPVSDAHGIGQWWEDDLRLMALPNSKLIDTHLKSLVS